MVLDYRQLKKEFKEKNYKNYKSDQISDGSEEKCHEVRPKNIQIDGPSIDWDALYDESFAS